MIGYPYYTIKFHLVPSCTSLHPPFPIPSGASIHAALYPSMYPCLCCSVSLCIPVCPSPYHCVILYAPLNAPLCFTLHPSTSTCTPLHPSASLLSHSVPLFTPMHSSTLTHSTPPHPSIHSSEPTHTPLCHSQISSRSANNARQVFLDVCIAIVIVISNFQIFSRAVVNSIAL